MGPGSSAEAAGAEVWVGSRRSLAWEARTGSPERPGPDTRDGPVVGNPDQGPCRCDGMGEPDAPGNSEVTEICPRRPGRVAGEGVDARNAVIVIFLCRSAAKGVVVSNEAIEISLYRYGETGARGVPAHREAAIESVPYRLGKVI